MAAEAIVLPSEVRESGVFRSIWAVFPVPLLARLLDDFIRPEEEHRGDRQAEDFLPFVNPNLSHFLPHLHDRLTTNPAGIIARTMTQHGHQDTQESVANIA